MGCLQCFLQQACEDLFAAVAPLEGRLTERVALQAVGFCTHARGISGWHRSVVHLLHQQYTTVRLGRAKLVCTVHMSGRHAAQLTSHPTEPLVQGTHHLLHLRTDVEIKVFLASEALMCLVLKLISLIFSFALLHQMAGADPSLDWNARAHGWKYPAKSSPPH